MLNTKLRVRCGNDLSETFATNTGVPQGDSLSANQFTVYLARTLEETPAHIDHNYTSYANDMRKILQHDHTYSRKPNNAITLNQEYADDISIITTNPNIIYNKKITLPPKLSKRDLIINQTKTEEYEIKKGGDNSWKQCKLLGSLLDTKSDINRRKTLAITSIANMKSIFQTKVSLKIKIRAFDCYVGSIFLYNSELWTLTKTLENEIDSFHRKLLRSAVINITWPKKLENVKVYQLTNTTPWSVVVKKRQLSWFGHLMRLSDDTPAKLALAHVLHYPSTRSRGRQAITWISMMSKRFEELGTNWEAASILAQDRVAWRRFLRSTSK